MPTKKHFAAANGFDGFTSYFDRIFDSKLLSRLFILKGGPGTGKSSFMKRVAEHFLETEYEIEEFYCSSDPKSLDGIIIKSGKALVAVIDGTAPHERDTRFPGTVDTLINLGENWDDRWLYENREKIFALNDEKRSAYKTAYKYLELGKVAFDFIYEIYKKAFDYRAARDAARKIMNGMNTDDLPSESIRLISAFGKNGLVRFNTVEQCSDNIVKISGNELSSMIFISVLREVAKEKGISFQSSPFPLSGELSEAIYFEKCKTGIVINQNDATLDADKFTVKLENSSLEKIRKAKEIIASTTDEAIRWFNIAADLHFRLEEIYTQAMNFEKNDELISKIIKETEIIFDNEK